jgi:hypothetical protein
VRKAFQRARQRSAAFVFTLLLRFDPNFATAGENGNMFKKGSRPEGKEEGDIP